MTNNIFLITDADGTLLTDDKRILDVDKEAIRRLTDGGGLFTLATGRGIALTKPLAEELNLAVPAVIFNGAAVYDFSCDRFLWQSPLPDTASAYASYFLEKFPNMAIEVLRGNDIYVPRSNDLEEEHLSYACTNPIRCAFDKIPKDGWLKILLVDEPRVIDELIAYTDENPLNGIHLTRSSPIFYEMLAHGVNKGSGLRKLLELMGISGYTVAAAGDYMNDIEMLEAADIGIAVDNACDEVKKHADFTVCDNNSGAVCEMIERLDIMKSFR